MISKYLEEALKRASYEIIDDEEPYYGEVAELQGVWASGKTLEECRQNLLDVVEGWVLLRLTNGMNVPALGQVQIELPKETVDV